MHLTGVQRDGSRLFIRFLSRLAFHINQALKSIRVQKNRCNYLITRSIKIFPTPRRRRSFDIINISAIGPNNNKLAVLP